MMSTSLRCALHAFSILFALLPVEASSRQAGHPVDQSVAIGNQAADEARIPVNLVLIPTLRPVVERMWHQSPTFKAQCARLRQTPSLLVDIRFGNASQLGAARGRTHFRRSSRHASRADIYIDFELRSVHQWIEMIAHELEHVIEQLDEVELTPGDRHGVYLTASGAFETARALHIGQQVGREVDDVAYKAPTLRRQCGCDCTRSGVGVEPLRCE